MGLLGRFFRGALSIPEMDKMKIKQIMFWYGIFETQSMTEIVVNELSTNPKTGKARKLPHPTRIREIVNERIEERKTSGG